MSPGSKTLRKKSPGQAPAKQDSHFQSDAGDAAILPAAGDRRLAWAASLLIVLPVLVQWPYFHAPHTYDDLRHLGLLGELQLGRLSWPAYLTRFHNEHFLLLWKLWYYATWRLAGLAPPLWHLGIALGQGVSAWCLQAATFRFTGQRAAALAAGVLSAGATLGSFDNPYVWIGASHLSLAVMFLLAAWACVGYGGGARPRLMAVLMGLCLTAAIATMGVMWLLAPVVLLAWWSSDTRKQHPQLAPWWLTSGLLPIVLLGGFQLVILSQIDLGAGFGHDRPIPWGGVLNGFWNIFAMALARLIAGAHCEATPTTIFACGLLGLLLLGGLAWVAPAVRRHVLLILLAAGAYTFLVAVARSRMMPPAAMPQFGRFAFLPTLAWCAVIGALFAAVWQRVASARRSAAIAVVLLLAAGFFGQQFLLAQSAEKLFREKNALSLNAFQANQEVLKRLVARTRGGVAQVLDFPVYNHPEHQRLSTFAAYAQPAWQRQVKFVAPADASIAPNLAQEMAAALREQETPQADAWLAWLKLYAAAGATLRQWNGRAGQSQPLIFPQVAVTVPQAAKPLPLARLIAFCFENPPANLAVLPATAQRREDALRLLSAIKERDNPFTQLIGGTQPVP